MSSGETGAGAGRLAAGLSKDPQPFTEALARFLDEAPEGWSGLPFFRAGSGERVCAALDLRWRNGAAILPQPDTVFAALRHAPPAMIRVVILGQDPYPTPGDAHGLAFSVLPGRAVPRSLANIFRELASDLGLPPPANGCLLSWAEQGVLLLNSALTVEAGAAGAHRRLGWTALADQAVRAVSQQSSGAVFVLWGQDAAARRPLVDETRHLVIASAHPSPLSARRGFFGSRPFSRANAWLAAKGGDPIDWRLA